MEYPNPSTTEVITLDSGRKLGWAVYGGLAPDSESSASSKTIFYFHGFPGSRLECRLLPLELLQALNVRCIAIDRPGMGLSSYDHNRKVIDWPKDVLTVADHLGIDKFYVWGVSGGSPYAMACAKALASPHAGSEDGENGKTRLLGTAVVSGVWPLELGTENMLFGPRMILTAGAWLPRMVTSTMMDLAFGRAARNTDTKVLDDLFDKEMSRRPEMERECYKDEEVRRVCIDSLRESFTQGSQGAATDLMLYSDWGFNLKEIDGNGVYIWHGKLDENAPAHMAEKAAAALPGAQLYLLDQEGHLSTPVRHKEAILKQLIGFGS